MRFIAGDRPGAARAWFDALHRRVGDLGRFPRRGRVVPELAREEYRELIIAPFRVVYRVDSKRVVILAVRHGRQATGDR